MTALSMIWLLGCAPPAADVSWTRPPPTPVDTPVWPAPGAPLTILPERAPRNERRLTVFLVAGHGNGDKQGNTGVHGQIEATVALQTVSALAERLESLDRFDVILGRQGDARPSYPERLEHAERVGADVFIELHTDSRGDTWAWADLPDGEAYRAEGDAGFAVLFNEGSELGPKRRALARATANALSEAGFPAYPGCHYGGLYDPDSTPGVFIDRRGLMMLRRPTAPSIIIETHNAKDFDESLRWREEATLDAFSSGIADALLRYRPTGP